MIKKNFQQFFTIFIFKNLGIFAFASSFATCTKLYSDLNPEKQKTTYIKIQKHIKSIIIQNLNLNNPKNMTSLITNLNLTLVSNATITSYRDRVIASGVALLAAYFINYLFQFLITVFRTENKAAVMRKLMESSQVMYWFGVASLFSIYPPFYYGGFNAIIGYITLILVLLMHVFCLTDKKIGERSLWAITYFLYHLLILIWIIVGLILAYVWSNLAYNVQ